MGSAARRSLGVEASCPSLWTWCGRREALPLDLVASSQVTAEARARSRGDCKAAELSAHPDVSARISGDARRGREGQTGARSRAGRAGAARRGGDLDAVPTPARGCGVLPGRYGPQARTSGLPSQERLEGVVAATAVALTGQPRRWVGGLNRHAHVPDRRHSRRTARRSAHRHRVLAPGGERGEGPGPAHAVDHADRAGRLRRAAPGRTLAGRLGHGRRAQHRRTAGQPARGSSSATTTRPWATTDARRSSRRPRSPPRRSPSVRTRRG